MQRSSETRRGENSSFRMMARGLTLTLILLLFAGMTAPAMAADKYLYGSPTLSASIAGTNEFSPGQEMALAVNLKNSGLNTFKFVDPTAVARDDLPNTAKLVTAALGTDAAPVTVKTDPQFLGDIAGGKSVTATFTVKVAENAAPGTYNLPLTVTYTYLSSAEQYRQRQHPVLLRGEDRGPPARGHDHPRPPA